tara:strand:+ start:933 stop:1160 length:228 start_codon:yes stop_codon:yes gene_type:complete
MDEKLNQTQITCTVYFYTDENGYIVIDDDATIAEFQRKLENVYLQTKHGKRKWYNENLKQQFYGKNKQDESDRDM